MNNIQVPILALFLSVGCIPYAFAENRVFVAAQETQASVKPRTGQERLVNLPALTFDFRVAIACPGESESLTLSVADTFRTFTKEDIGGHRSTETSLSVPARQLTLASTNTFCTKDDAEASSDELVVPGFLTAFASLRCAGQRGPSMHYASAPLQVRLKCEREPDESQESSPDK
jgi:hypothetical protein